MSHLDSSLPLNAAWMTSWKATARGTTSAPPNVRGEGPLLLAKELVGREGAGPGGGCDRLPPPPTLANGESDRTGSWRGESDLIKTSFFLHKWPKCQIACGLEKKVIP